MIHYSGVQRAAALSHIGEIHEGPVRQTQRQIQIAEADVTVQTQNAAAAESQGLSYTGGKGCFARSAFTGNYGNALSHRSTSPRVI
jgi:hypothetical protein